jgi:hypothetical protein
MRLNARNGAALLAIVVGLVVVVFAALGSKGSLPGTLKPAPPIPVATGPIAPIDPNAGVSKNVGKKTDGDKALRSMPGFSKDPFATEYGERGKHEVTVTITTNGGSAYLLTWRGGKSERGSAKGLTRTRTIYGGLPVVQVIGQAISPASRITCTITVDGVKKVTQTTTGTWSVVTCLG